MGKKVEPQKVESHQEYSYDPLFEDQSESLSQSSHQGSPAVASKIQVQPQPIKIDKITKGKNKKKTNEKSQSNQIKAEKVRNFQCAICLLRYGSQAATHTHINTKHPERKKNKKKLIINLNRLRPEQRDNHHIGIRMKDIEYPVIEAGCMEKSDLALYNIYGCMKELYTAKKDPRLDVLLSQNDTDFYDEIQGDDVSGANRVPTERERNIEYQVNMLMRAHKITDLTEKIKDYYEFKTIHEQKFYLRLDEELTKFFKPTFAARVKLQLEITAALERDINPQILQITTDSSKNIDSKLRQNMLECEREIWPGEDRRIMQEIKKYYHEWVGLTWKYLKQMMQADKIAQRALQAERRLQGNNFADGDFQVMV